MECHVHTQHHSRDGFGRRVASVLSGWSALPLLFLALFIGCKRPAVNDAKDVDDEGRSAWFADVTDEIGLDFTHDAGPIDGKYFMPQSVGSGAALFNAEGRLHVYLLNNGGPLGRKNQLFRQKPDGTFEDVSAGSGLDVAGHGMGVAVGDVNNDGLPDVYVSEYDGGRLFLNRGKGTFQQVRDSGLAPQRWGTAVSFFDYDRDGWLDLVVVNYVEVDPTHVCSRGGSPDYCNPEIFKPCLARLYRNRGRDKAGKWLGYEDRTDAAQMGRTPGPGLGVLCADFNGDGWPDVFVANDGAANHLWINQRDGTFKEEAVLRGVAFNARGEHQGNMGVAWGDLDDKGRSSLFVTHLLPQRPGLWTEVPGPRRGYFQENAAGVGLTTSRWRGTGWGAVMADFDNDGSLDLALVNGKVFRNGKPPSASHWDAYAERNQVFANDGRGRFRDVSRSNPALCGTPNVGRGLAMGDFNNDGGLDLLVTTAGGKARVLRNVAANRGHWLTIRAVDPALKRDALGAEVRVHSGSRQWRRLIQPSQSYLCGNDPRAHLGLGEASRIEAIEIVWPDGDVEQFHCDHVDRVIELQRGKGRPIQPKGDRSP